LLESLIALTILLIIALTGRWLFHPEQGRFWRWQRARQVTARVLREDALKHIHRCERHGRRPSLESLAGALHLTVDEAAELLSQLEQHHLVALAGDSFRLTPDGHDYALHIIRAHRLWERYLADATGYAQEEWHEQAEQAEHALSPEALDALAAELGHPTHDPHGDPIPTAAGEIIAHGGRPLTAMQPGTPLRIVHLEDEPEAVFAQLVAEGIHPGMVIGLIENSPRRVRLWADDDEHLLAPIVAANISVVPLPQPAAAAEEAGERLSSLKPGEQGEVVAVSRAGRASERRRFLDLGILPGTIIMAEMTSPSGDPTAYRVREALIALRQEQADLIRIRRMPVEAKPS
jgi:DtxR family transcriptional regulator, Mn-dependent transcriptional regulator